MVILLSIIQSQIDGLSTAQNYRILKLDEDSFRLTAAGIGSTATDLAFNKKEYVKIRSIGSASHTFKYPDIHVSVDGVTGLFLQILHFLYLE